MELENDEDIDKVKGTISERIDNLIKAGRFDEIDVLFKLENDDYIYKVKGYKPANNIVQSKS